MEAALHLLLFSLVLQVTCLIAQRPSLPNAFVFPLTKDASTLQYTAEISMGTPHLPTKLVVDLGGSSIWVDCASRSVSSSQSFIQSGSLPCSMAKAGYTYIRVTHQGICDIYPENTITKMATAGYLAEDKLTVDCQDRLKMYSVATVDHFLFSCTSSLLLKGLAGGAKGMLGLGKSKISLASQISNNVFSLHRKFALCLSSSDGVIFAGGGPHDITRSLVYTPLISPQDGAIEEYYINVKSIKINGKKLSLGEKAIGEAKLSTIVPYTTLESKIYETLSKAYIQAATSLNMSRAASVAPFGVCFSTKGVEKTSVGPAVPNIDLVLQSEMVKWRIHGRNSMVQVSDEVMCLGLLDGGLNPKNSIVIGGYQLEDNLLEFNLGTSMLGFSSSISMERAGCASFISVSEPRDTLIFAGIWNLDLDNT